MVSRRWCWPRPRPSALIDELNADDAVDGMLVQLPVPDRLSEVAIASRIHPDKDVDSFSPISLGRLIRGEPGSVPCTPAGIMWLLDRAGVELEGAEAVVVGRSLIVGKPMALLLTSRSATVTWPTRAPATCKGCAGAPTSSWRRSAGRMIRGDWIKPGAAVIDVGINRTDAGLVGDVAGDEAPAAGGSPPSPGESAR